MFEMYFGEPLVNPFVLCMHREKNCTLHITNHLLLQMWQNPNRISLNSEFSDGSHQNLVSLNCGLFACISSLELAQVHHRSEDLTYNEVG